MKPKTKPKNTQKKNKKKKTEFDNQNEFSTHALSPNDRVSTYPSSNAGLSKTIIQHLKGGVTGWILYQPVF